MELGTRLDIEFMILSIESSCDDSSIAITQISDAKVLFHKKISQEEEHAKYGGVVPELASRLHAKELPRILEEAKGYLPDIKAVAVTNEPGLSVTLLEGVAMAKALSIALNIPLIGIHHLKAHIYSLFIDDIVKFPQTVLLVSGGHTQIIEAKSHTDMEVIATSIDDSFGESFDKVAKMMGLGYPGGPIIEELARSGDENRFAFPIPLLHSNRLAFSYSGLKNAVRLEIEKLGDLSEQDRYDVAASFQKAATEHLLHKTRYYFRKNTPKSVAIVGGASANLYLRNRLETLCASFSAPLLVAQLKYCSDNAAMVGRCAIESYKNNEFSSINELLVHPKSSEIN